MIEILNRVNLNKNIKCIFINIKLKNKWDSFEKPRIV